VIEFKNTGWSAQWILCYNLQPEGTVQVHTQIGVVPRHNRTFRGRPMMKKNYFTLKDTVLILNPVEEGW
jgi:hypothetical protein